MQNKNVKWSMTRAIIWTRLPILEKLNCGRSGQHQNFCLVTLIWPKCRVKLRVLGTIEVTTIKLDSKTCMGLKVDLPDGPPLLLVVADKGFVMCGFLNMETAERLGVAAAMVSGVKTFDDVLNAQVKAATDKTKNLGVEVGAKGSEALKRMI